MEFQQTIQTPWNLIIQTIFYCSIYTEKVGQSRNLWVMVVYCNHC